MNPLKFGEGGIVNLEVLYILGAELFKKLTGGAII